MCILLFQKECLKLLQVLYISLYIHVYENCVDICLPACLPASLDSLAYESILLGTVDVLEITKLFNKLLIR